MGILLFFQYSRKGIFACGVTVVHFPVKTFVESLGNGLALFCQFRTPFGEKAVVELFQLKLILPEEGVTDLMGAVGNGSIGKKPIQRFCEGTPVDQCSGNADGTGHIQFIRIKKNLGFHGLWR